MPSIIGNSPAENKGTAVAGTQEATPKAPQTTHEEMRQEILNQPYVDKKTITISLVNNYSYFRRANDKTMEKRNEFIGSSVHSSQTLSSSKGEVEVYFPSLIGISVSDPKFVQGVKEWLNNIQVRVDELGKELDVTFIYNSKNDYYKIAAEEEAIENRFKSVNRNNLKELKIALERKIKELNTLESTKYLVGRPQNVADYLLYRHCLLYKDIAKDVALINSDRNIRFYFRDNKKEEELQIKLRNEINTAKRNYVMLCGNDEMFENVYIQYCIHSNLAVTPALQESRLIKENNLDKFSSSEPAKFNRICNDKDLAIKSNIERLIAVGIFNKHPHSQNIVSAEGDFIGANMKEAVDYFKNPANSNIIDGYLTKLRFI